MKILINGACGRMGNELCRLLTCGYRGHILAGGIDPAAVGSTQLYRSPDEYTDAADVIIDFSHHSSAEALCRYACSRSFPLVIATTGHSIEETAQIHRAANRIPVFFAANLSLGIALLQRLSCLTASLFPESEIEIVELHHSRKLDAPSGTALALAQKLQNLRPESRVCRGAAHGRRLPEEIHVHSLRMGEHAGSHTILFGSEEQTITLTHTAHTPLSYAVGAIRAAEFLLSRKAGLYDMSHLLQSFQL